MYAALMTSRSIAPKAIVFGIWAVSSAVITVCWKALGTPRWFIWLISRLLSWELTSEPSSATPVAAPITRLVLAMDAAMPERSAGTADMTAEVIGTTVVAITERESTALDSRR